MDHEKSDEVVVAKKHVNKHAEPRAERIRRFLKGNIHKTPEVCSTYGNKTERYKNIITDLSQT